LLTLEELAGRKILGLTLLPRCTIGKEPCARVLAALAQQRLAGGGSEILERAEALPEMLVPFHRGVKNNWAIAYISIDMGSGGAAHSEPEA